MRADSNIWSVTQFLWPILLILSACHSGNYARSEWTADCEIPTIENHAASDQARAKPTQTGDILWIGHGGTINGSYASLRHYPCGQLTIAAISNYDFVWTGKRAEFFEIVRQELPRLFAPSSCRL